MSRQIFLGGFAGVFFFFSSVCHSGEDVAGSLRTLQARVEALEQRVSQQERYIQQQDQKLASYESRDAAQAASIQRSDVASPAIIGGIELGASVTMVMQGTQNSNNATAGVQKKESATDGTYSADITLAKEFKEAGGNAFLHVEAGQGAGIENNLTLYSNVNRDADNDNNVRVTEAWYEQQLFQERVSVKAGKLDATILFDTNEIANDETTKFLSRMFRNSPVVEFPDNTLGTRIAYTPLQRLELSCGVFDGNSDWEKISDNLFTIGQAAIKTDFFGLAGTYRLYGWQNNRYHTKWLDDTQTKEPTYGFGMSLDQKLSSAVTMFCRYGWQNPRVYNPDVTATGGLNFSLEQSWSTGLQIEGSLWNRDNDTIGFAVGQVIPSDEYKKAGATLDPARRAKTEGHLEAYYRIYVNEHVSVSPDLQYIWNPFGKDVSEDTAGIFVGGVRAQVNF